MSKQKKQYYFKSIYDETCHDLEYYLDDCISEAKEAGKDEFTLIEAIPDNDNPHYVWCTHYLEVVDRDQCRKSFCPHYESKSGRGVCQHRGNLYEPGEEVTFKVSDYDQTQ